MNEGTIYDRFDQIEAIVAELVQAVSRHSEMLASIAAVCERLSRHDEQLLQMWSEGRPT